MADFKGLETHENLRASFAAESETVFRYLYFATIAEIEGLHDAARLFRELAEGGTQSAHGNLDYLRQVGDPTTGLTIGETDRNLLAALTAETRQYAEHYPEMAERAREDGFPDIASWFETLAKSKRSHIERLTAAAQQIRDADRGESR